MRPITKAVPLLTWRLLDAGVQVYDNNGAPDGWLSAVRTCPACDLRLVVVVPNYAVGFECPACGHVDMLYEWSIDDARA